MSRSLTKEPASSAEPATLRTLYERDLSGWTNEQVTLLRAGRFDQIDAENIAEELQDVGGREYDKLESALEVLLMHMLKWDHQPERRGASWQITIAEQRERIAIQLRKNPGLKRQIEEAVQDGFRIGRLRAARETGLKPSIFPKRCPYDWTTIMNRDFGLGDDI
jgi:hypothetical protein